MRHAINTLLIVLTTTLVAGESLGQCSKGQCNVGGGRLGGPIAAGPNYQPAPPVYQTGPINSGGVLGGGVYGGTYQTTVPYAPTPTYSTYDPGYSTGIPGIQSTQTIPVTGPDTIQTHQKEPCPSELNDAESQGNSTDLNNSVEEEPETFVYFTHPTKDKEIMLKRTFKSRAEAEKMVDVLNSRHWIIYSNQGAVRYKEAKDSGSIGTVISEITSAGSTIVNVKKVESRIGEGTDFSLESQLSSEPETIPDDVSPSPRQEEPPSNPLLTSLVGKWSGVMKSDDGEPVTLKLKLDSGGSAQLEVPTRDGNAKLIESQAFIENEVLTLRNGNEESTIGKLTDIQSDRFVVELASGNVTFLKMD